MDRSFKFRSRTKVGNQVLKRFFSRPKPKPQIESFEADVNTYYDLRDKSIKKDQKKFKKHYQQSPYMAILNQLFDSQNYPNSQDYRGKVSKLKFYLKERPSKEQLNDLYEKFTYKLGTPTTYKKWFAHLQLQKLQNPEQFKNNVTGCIDQLITIFEPKNSSSASKQGDNIDRNSRNQLLKNEHDGIRSAQLELVESKRDDGDIDNQPPVRLDQIDVTVETKGDEPTLEQLLRNQHGRNCSAELEPVESKRDDGELDVATIVGELVDQVEINNCLNLLINQVEIDCLENGMAAYEPEHKLSDNQQPVGVDQINVTVESKGDDVVEQPLEQLLANSDSDYRLTLDQLNSLKQVMLMNNLIISSANEGAQACEMTSDDLKFPDDITVEKDLLADVLLDLKTRGEIKVNPTSGEGE
ncbi:MAG: hypothetical protein ACON35_04820 [Candidatus Marinamargulisbacteria bacterium]